MTGTRCPGVGGTAPESQTWVMTQKGAQVLPLSVLLRMPQGVVQPPGHSHHCHRCPWAVPCSHPAEQGVICCADRERAGGKNPESALSPPGSHKLQGWRCSPLNQMLLRASSHNRQFRTKQAIPQQGGGPTVLWGHHPHPVPAGANLLLPAVHSWTVLGILTGLQWGGDFSLGFTPSLP